MRKGNSLIIVIFLIAILLSMSFGISSLIAQETINTLSLENAHKAFYAAESGVESALLSLKNHLPGYEEDKEMLLGQTTVHYSVQAQTNKIPFDPSQENMLSPSQIVTLALFKDTGETTPVIQDTTDFSLSFHTQSTIATCLRWTLFGFTKDGSTTESMGGYIGCSLDAGTLDTASTGQFKKTSGEFFPAYEIRTFLQNHTQNYITLMNISDTLNSNDNLFYTLSFSGEKMADEYFRITSTGISRNFKQTEQVVTPQGDISPALYFSIVNP